MSTGRTVLFGLALGLVIGVGLGEAEAQQRGQEQIVRIRRLEGDMVRTPQYQVSGISRGRRQRQWLQIRTEFETRPEWVDEMTFTYYVVLHNRRAERGQEEFVLFRGESRYVNIARTRDGQSVVYLHPSTVERYGELFRVGVVISAGGRMLAMESSPAAEGRWWEQLSPRDGYVRHRMQTPFAMVNFDDFEASPPRE